MQWTKRYFYPLALNMLRLTVLMVTAFGNASPVALNIMKLHGLKHLPKTITRHGSLHAIQSYHNENAHIQTKTDYIRSSKRNDDKSYICQVRMFNHNSFKVQFEDIFHVCDAHNNKTPPVQKIHTKILRISLMCLSCNSPLPFNLLK